MNVVTLKRRITPLMVPSPTGEGEGKRRLVVFFACSHQSYKRYAIFIEERRGKANIDQVRY